ncbi:MAG TPA: hypothetical protein VF160_14040 [Candidatus Dormibacteraeota bacterium]
MSLYGIIADLRREHQTPSASRTLDMVVAELGRTRDNLREAVAHLEDKPVPAGGKSVLEELLQKAEAEGVADLERAPAPGDPPAYEPIDEGQVGIAVLLGGSAILAVGLGILAFLIGLNQIVHFA